MLKEKTLPLRAPKGQPSTRRVTQDKVRGKVVRFSRYCVCLRGHKKSYYVNVALGECTIFVFLSYSLLNLTQEKQDIQVFHKPCIHVRGKTFQVHLVYQISYFILVYGDRYSRIGKSSRIPINKTGMLTASPTCNFKNSKNAL